MGRYSYSQWDGTQTGFDFDADDLLGQLADDLLYHGDLNAALRRLMQSGFERDRDRMLGTREMLERLRQRRRELLENNDLGGVYQEIADELREIVDAERREVDRLDEQARQSGDGRRADVARDAMAEKRMQLDLLPRDLAGQLRELQEYDFVSGEAQQRFEELTDKLRQQLVNQFFDRAQQGMQELDAEQIARMREMMSALNRMIEQRDQGQPLDPSFDDFMSRYGDFFPGNPENLDELLEQLARQMAAAQAMLNSMSPGQRAQLQQMAQQLLGDMDLRFEMARLTQNLQSAFPGAGWDRRYAFSGADPLDMMSGAQLMEELGDIDDLEGMLASATSPTALAEVDLDRARNVLGEDGAESLRRMSELARMLEEAGLIEVKEGRTELTARGIRRIGQRVLSDLFTRLQKDRLGRHEQHHTGGGHERTYETKPYEFGDPFNLHIERTVRNAIQRTGGGTPVRLTPDDFEVERTETITRSATVLLLDLSLSMPLADNFLAAKKVAMALHALISGQYPRDYLGIVGFSRVAREIKPHELPEVSWDFAYGTNMQHALMLSRRMLSREHGTKQIIMITDGEPTAHLVDGMDEPFFHYPPVRETLEATLGEVFRCTRDGIRINTFVLDATERLRAFVEQMTQINRGRAFFTSPDTLGDYVLVDFIEHRRQQTRGRSRRA